MTLTEDPTAARGPASVEAEPELDLDADAEPELGLDADGEIVSRSGGIAGATTDAVKDYLQQLSRVPLLTAEGEVELAKRIEVGVFAQEKLDSGADLDDELSRDLEWLARDGAIAKENLVGANLRLVVSIAKRYTGRGMHFLDVIQEGNMGLVRAVEKFDFSTGFKFSTYGSWWIRQSITRALANQGRTIRIPVHTAEILNTIAGFERELRVESGREPTVHEIAAGVDLPVDTVKNLQAHGREPLSLHTALSDDRNGGELGDIIEDGDAAEPLDAVAASMMNQHVATLLHGLTSRERDIITMRFGLGGVPTETYERIGSLHGVTRERIRQLEGKIIANLRTKADRGYLEN